MVPKHISCASQCMKVKLLNTQSHSMVFICLVVQLLSFSIMSYICGQFLAEAWELQHHDFNHHIVVGS